MSAGAEFWVCNVLVTDRRLSHADFRIIAFMALKAYNTTHDCRWGERRIAEQTGVSRGTVSKSAHKMEKLGILNIRQEPVKDSKYKKRNIYFLNLPVEYRRRGSKAVNGTAESTDFSPIDGLFDQGIYEERLVCEFQDDEQIFRETRINAQ